MSHYNIYNYVSLQHFVCMDMTLLTTNNIHDNLTEEKTTNFLLLTIFFLLELYLLMIAFFLGKLKENLFKFTN